MGQPTKPLTDSLSETVGGEWKVSSDQAGVPGVSAHFPQFRSEAIVSVLNDVAAQIGSDVQVVALRTGAARHLGDQDPNAPREVVVPAKLAEHPAFAQAVDQQSDRLRDTITEQTSRLLSNAAQRGFQR